MGVSGQSHAPASLPSGKARYPLYTRLDGLQGRSGRVRKISPPLRFDPRTVQPVASRYTDWAIPVHKNVKGGFRKKIEKLWFNWRRSQVVQLRAWGTCDRGIGLACQGCASTSSLHVPRGSWGGVQGPIRWIPEAGVNKLRTLLLQWLLYFVRWRLIFVRNQYGIRVLSTL